MPLIFVPQNFHIYKRSGHKFPRKTGSLKHQLPSLVDHFDRYFSHRATTLVLKSIRHFLTVGTLTFGYVWGCWKKFPCGALLPTPPQPLQPFILLRIYVIALGCLCFALPFYPLSSSTSSLYLSSFVLFVYGYVFVFCLTFLFFLLCLYL